MTVQKKLSASEKLALLKEAKELEYRRMCIAASKPDGFPIYCKIMSMKEGFEDSHDIASHSSFRELPFIRLLQKKLLELESGSLQSAALSMPPQHGKSYTATRMFMSWYMGVHPTHRAVLVTYSDEFAETEHGAAITKLVTSKRFADIFPDFKIKAKRASGFTTEQGGSCKYQGRDSGITGRALNLIVVDDLYKDVSETKGAVGAGIHEKFYGNVISRIRASTRILLIGTRWAEDDIIGRYADPDHSDYKEKPGHAELVDGWGLINIPAILDRQEIVEELNTFVYEGEAKYKIGDALDPVEHPLKGGSFSLQAKRAMYGSSFSALYMGRPTPAEGDEIQISWIKQHDPRKISVPKNAKIYASLDLATTSEIKKDATSMTFGFIDEENVARITEITNDRKEREDMGKRIIDLCEEHNPSIIWTEKGTIWRLFSPTLYQEMDRRGVWYHFVDIANKGDKSIRSIPMKTMMKHGYVTFAQSYWIDDFVSQCLKFPKGTFDDMVDSASLWCANVTSMLKTAAFEEEEEEELTGEQIVMQSLRNRRKKSNVDGGILVLKRQ